MRTLLAGPSSAAPAVVLAVSAPGGAARHFRVQIQLDEPVPRWRLHASFRDFSSAQTCLDDLRRRDIEARVVFYQALPTAA